MTPIEKLISEVEMKPTDQTHDNGDLPYVTHTGVLHIAGHELRVHQLSSGQRVFQAEDVEKLFSPPQ